MTVTLAPENEVHIRQRAAREGKDIDVVHQALLASGLVKRIARRTEPDTSQRHLVEVQGEPVSETILRERH